jgi:WD40 repeat protein
LLEALARHESFLRAGRDLPAEELCGGFPELLGQLRLALQQMRVFRQRFQGENGLATASPFVHVSPPGYVIERELGTGGMGVVYLARQEGLDRPVALKMIRMSGLMGSTEVARFVTEAQVLARLRHPHIVQVFEIGQHDGQPFFSMEYCPGGSLYERLGAASMQAAEAARLLRQLAEAVAHAHAQGIVHRDLKPGNVLLDEANQAKITDFGMAQRLDRDVGLTQTGEVLGTPAYMAPEQARGDRNLTVAVDVYALGAILYECLTGRPPFQGATVGEILEQARIREPVLPRRLNPSVPRDLETICLKCLAKEPSRRYRSAQELADDLQRFIEKRPIRARPVGWLESARLWMRRNPVLAGVTLLATLGILTALVVSIVFAVVKSWDAATLATQARALTKEIEAKEKALAEVAARQGELERSELTGSLRRVGSLWRENAAEARQILMDPELCPPKARDFAWGYLSRLTADTVQELAHELDPIRGIAWLPDGERLVTITRPWKQEGRSGMMQVREARTGKSLGTFAGKPHMLTTLAIAPVGNTIVTGGHDAMNRAQVIVWDLTKLAPVRTIDYPAAKFVRALAVSRKGRFVVAGMDTGAVVLWDLDRPGAEPWSRPAHRDLVWGVAVTEDGQTVASCCPDGGTVIVHDRQNDRTYSAEAMRPTRVVFWSPDLIQIASQDGLYLWSFKAQPKPSGTEGRVVVEMTSLDRVVDSNRVVVAAMDKVIRVLDSDGRVVASLPRGSDEDHAALSPDGERVAVGTFEGKVLLWHPEGVATRVMRLPHPLRLFRGNEERVGIFTSDGWFYEVEPRRARFLWPTRPGFGKFTAAAFLNGGLTLLSVGMTPEGKPALQWWDLQKDDLARGERKPDLSETIDKPARWLLTDADERFAVLGNHDGFSAEKRQQGWLQVIPLPKGKAGPCWTRSGHFLICATLSQDGRFLLSGWSTGLLGTPEPRDGFVELRDRESGEILAGIPVAKSAVTAVAISAGGRWAAWADETGKISVRDHATGKLASLRGHRGMVHALAFTPDGRQLASGGSLGSRQGELRLWQIPTWQEEVVFEFDSRFDPRLNRHVDGAVRSLLFTDQGRILTVATDDDQIRFLSGGPLDEPAP